MSVMNGVEGPAEETDHRAPGQARTARPA
jgi:hypothetical protein